MSKSAATPLSKKRPKAAANKHARSRLALERQVPGEAVHSRAYAVLKEAVLAGHFQPGEVVTLRSLATQLAISDMPVREALRRLTSEGAFEALPNRSARVPVLKRAEVRQILELRQTLEGMAAAQAARNITLVQIEHLRALQRGIEEAVQKGDWLSYSSLNMAFHFEIYRIADNPTLIPLIQMLWLRMAPLLAGVIPTLTKSRPAAFKRVGVENHERLLTAFQARDPVTAEQAMRQDLIATTKIPGYWEALRLTPD